MELHNPLIKGTFILTVTGLLTRFMGFFYRIFLSHTFGAVQVGLYQLIFPIYALGYSATCAGIQTILSPQCCQPSCSGQKKRSPPASLYRTSHHVVRLLLFYNFSAKIRAIFSWLCTW